MKPAASVLLAASLLMAGAATWSQTQSRSATVYRCGNELRDSPCPAGPGASSTVGYDQPSAADAKAAREHAAADARRAAELEKAHREAEARALKANARAIGLQAPLAPPSAASAPPAEKTRKLPKPPKHAKAQHPPAKAASQAAR